MASKQRVFFIIDVLPATLVATEERQQGAKSCSMVVSRGFCHCPIRGHLASSDAAHIAPMCLHGYDD
jgi:hypothetical protein